MATYPTSRSDVPASPFLSSESPVRRGSAFSPFSPSVGKSREYDHDDAYALQASAATPRLGTQFASNRGRKSEAPPVSLPTPAGLRWTTSKSHGRRPSAIARLQTALDPRAVVMTPGRLAGLVVVIFLAGYISSFLPSVFSDAPASTPGLKRDANLPTYPIHGFEGEQHYAGRGRPDSPPQGAPAYLEPGLRKAAGEAGKPKPNRRKGPARMRAEETDELSAAVEARRAVTRPGEPEAARSDPHASKPQRDKQFQRVKKMAAAKAQNARIGDSAPADSAAWARSEQDRVITEGGASKQRRLRKPSGSLAEFAAEMAAEKEQAIGTQQNHADHVAYGDIVPKRRLSQAQQEDGLHEDLGTEFDLA